MELRFSLRIHHSRLSGIEAGGCFVSEFDGNHLKTGVFRFSEYGEVAMSEVQRVIETSHLTKGLRLRERQVRFVCVLKKPASSENSEDTDDEAADDPYFCATICSNGWQLINAIIDIIDEDKDKKEVS